MQVSKLNNIVISILSSQRIIQYKTNERQINTIDILLLFINNKNKYAYILK